MNQKIREIGRRIHAMRELEDISAEDMAQTVGMSLEEYNLYEAGEKDFSFSLLYEIALKLGVDITELLTGEMPHLSRFSLIRAGEGLPIERRKGFAYQHMAYLMKNRASEPFRVVAKYDPALEKEPIHLSSHAGHEFDYILEGTLRVQIENHIMDMHPGDGIYYDAHNRHGMIAIGGDCVFLAVISAGDDKTERN